MLMSNPFVTFADAIFGDLTGYFQILLLSCLFYYIIFRSSILSVLDPLFIPVAMMVFGSTGVLFLYQKEIIKIYYLYSYFASEFAFLIGFTFIRKIRYKFSSHNIIQKSIPISMYGVARVLFVSFLIYLIPQLYVAFKIGAAIFTDESRISFYQDGFGFVPLLNAVVAPVIFITSTYLIAKSRSVTVKVSLITVVIIVAVVSSLSGSKSTLLPLLYSLYLIYLFLNKNIMNKGYSEHAQQSSSMQLYMHLTLLISIVVGISVVLARESTEADILSSLLQFLFRFAMASDIYAYVYGCDCMNIFNSNNPLLSLLGPPLGALRFVDYSDIPKAIGLEVWQYYHNSLEILGPNSRHQVIGLVYFGIWGSVIFSFALGVILSSVKKIQFHLLSGDILNVVLYYYLITHAAGFVADFSYSFNLFFISVCYFCFCYLINLPFYARGDKSCTIGGEVIAPINAAIKSSQ